MPAGVVPTRITLLTDFGTADGYVAAMKGVIATIAPFVIVDDASHEIAAGDVAAAAWAVEAYWALYPAGTVHVAVVDPGVGSERRALAASIDGRFFVGPDNGIFSPLLRRSDARVVEISNRSVMRDVVSSTFHGRDVFAPAAAHLAAGMPLDHLGPHIGAPVLLPQRRCAHDAQRTVGEVVHVDRFGNVVTSVPADLAAAQVGSATVVSVAGRAVRIVRTYADAEPGEPVALEGSRGLLEIAVRDGSAARALRVGVGDEVVVMRSGASA